MKHFAICHWLFIICHSNRKSQIANHKSLRGGYIFLVTILVVGAIATSATVSLMLLGIAAEQNGFTVTQSTQAIELAQGCVERALLSLRSDLNYAGGETVSFPFGSCRILPIGGGGNEKRILCVEGTSGRNIRRLEVIVDQVYPITRIDSWQEEASFTQCP